MIAKHHLHQSVSFVVVLSMIIQMLALPLAPPAAASAPAEVPAATSPALPGELAAAPPAGTPARASTATIATMASTATGPAALVDPLSVSRVQSTYQAGSSVTITYTVTNNRPPTRYPAIPAGATITETIALTAAYDEERDPNTLRNVLLTTRLTGAAVYGSAAPIPDQNGATLAWSLGAIPPMTSKTAVLVLDAPLSVNDFTDLDAGASAWGMLQGRAVSAVTAPAGLAPDGLAQWLIWTIDADIYDEAMLAQAAELGQDPARLFEFVRAVDFESYDGSLRGTRGTLWSGAGNGVDQASLLIAMLRAAGIPARYRHGTLSTNQAQALIGSMFPDRARYVGQVAAEAEKSDPLNDPDLLAETADHWWVEAYLPGQGWRDMDPSFPDAVIGDSFAAPAGDGSDRIAELPDAVRHKITVRLKVENYHPLNVGNGNLAYTYPFAHTLNTVEVAARPVSFSHLVETEGQPGLVYSTVTHTYTPYLLIGDQELFGESYQEIFTTFPLGTLLLTGAWLELDLMAPDGETESYEREVKDRIGHEHRFGGGTADLAIDDDDSALFTEFDILAIGFWPNFIPEVARERAQAEALASIAATNADSQRLLELRDQESFTPAEEDELRGIRVRYQVNMSRYLSNLALSFAEAADRLARDLGEGGFVKSYYDAPRLIIAGSEILSDETGSFSLDLRRTTLRTIAYPGQDRKATVGFNIARGVIESGIEGAVLEESVGTAPATTARLFEAAQEQGVFPVAVDAGNLYTLDGLSISEQSKSRITEAALDGKLIYVPHAPVLLDGEHQSGWWEIDAVTGETIGVMENGLHLAALEYAISIALEVISGPLVDFVLGFTAYTWGFVANHVDKAIGPDTFNQGGYDSAIGNYGTTLTCMATVAMPSVYGAFSCYGGGIGGQTGMTLDFFGAGQKAAEALLTSRVEGDPPLSDSWLAHRPAAAPVSQVSREVAGTAAFNAGPLSLSLDTSYLAHSGTSQAQWAGPGNNTYPFTTLTISQGDLYDANGALLGSGSLSAASTGGSPATVTAPVDASINGDGNAAYYATALSGLGGSATWDDYAGQLSGGSNYTLTLNDADVSLNGAVYNGNLTVETSDPAIFDGYGNGGSVNFAPAADFEYTSVDLIIGPASGTATADGAPVDTTNGLAIANTDQTLALSEADASADHVELDDTVDFFTLNLSPDSSTTDPQTAVSFQSNIDANFSGAYTLTVSGPDGWDLSLSSSGLITAQPAPGTAAGDYSILVTAQSVAYPDLFLSAVHTVSIGEFDGLLLDVQPDPIFTVPMGPVRNPYTLVPADTNTGQAQVPGAAYTINVTNTANAERTIDLSVSGLPAGWTLLSTEPDVTQTSLTLAAGEVGQVGLYVNPGDLLGAGTNYDFTVTAASDSGPTAQDSDTFTMPSVPFSMLVPDPVVIYAGVNTTATVDLALTNVGNDSGSFPLASRSIADEVRASSTLQSPITLAPDESHTQPVTLEIGDAPVGQRFPVHFDSPVPGTVYTQTTAVFVQVVTPGTNAVFQAADSACTQAQSGLSPALQTLALAMTGLESACASGDCPPVLRDQVVDALEGVAAYADNVSSLVTADEALQAIAGDMVTHTDDADIEADVAAIGPVVSDLEAQVCEISEHQVAVSWAPAYDAALPGQPATYTLNVENEGTVTTTYAITVDLPAGQTTYNDAIPPGGTAIYDAVIDEQDLGLYELTGTAAATGPDVSLSGIGDEATARLNVVERFVQVTAVTADPAFVETGTSATNVSVDVTNVANVVQPVTARTAIVAPGGGASYTTDVPLTILAGAPRTYELAEVDTSGWTAGAYTITVDLLDEDGSVMSNGYGALGVGQALGAAHAVGPTLVAPGTSTVTTTITTTILGETAASTSTSASPIPWQPTGLRQAGDETNISAEENEGSPDAGGRTVDTRRPADLGDKASSEEASSDEGMPVEAPNEETQDEAPLPAPSISPSPNTVIGTDILRHEEDEAILTGNWTTAGSSRASSGNYIQADTAGDSATFTFDGSWVHLGFLANRYSGQAEVFIDGNSQGVIDLYRRDDMPVSFVYNGLGGGSHTLSVTVLGSANPYASDTDVRLDYLDAWDGNTFADGVFEQDDARVFSSTGWSNVADGAASGGTYMRDDAATAWFPFTGNSVTYQALAYSGGGKVRIAIDGVYQTTLDLYHPLSSITRTLSFDNLGSGPHVLQVSSYRGNATVDAFVTPGTAPFFTPPTPSGFTRFEEDHTALLYNGVPFTATAQTWTRHSHIFYSEASDGQRIYSRTAGDTATLTFDGEWVSVGFFTDHDSGMAEIYLDGASMGTVDLYSNEEDVASFSYDVAPGSHTISVTVLGTGNPLAGDALVHLDYVDTWDGSSLSTGRFEQTDDRVLRSGGWADVANGDTSGGSYSEAVLHGEPTAWFPFTGDSVTYQAYDYFRSDEVAIYIDEVFQGYYDIRTGNAPTLTYSFDGLGSGLHILKVRDYRKEATLDAFVTPAVSPPTPPPTPAVFTRHEEDDPAILYNGLQYAATASSWNRSNDVPRASDGQLIYSAAAGNTISFEFTGPWIAAGFLTSRDGGQAEVFIDGASQGVIDLYSRDNDVASFTYGDLGDTTHTISFTILSTNHANSTGTRVELDYFDTWDGTPLPDGTYEEDHALVYRSDVYDDWGIHAQAAASGGSYMSDDFFGNDGTIWFPFTGDSVTFLGLANGDADEVRISIDGVSQGAFNLYSGTPMTRAFSFDGLGSGPHVMEVRHYKGEPNADAFVVPGLPPFHETPVYTGVVRYEEDDPALVYNGDAGFRVRPQSWVLRKTWTTDSGGWHVYSGAAGDTVSLTFDGRWAGIGFLGRNGTSEAEVFIDGVSQGVLDLDNGGSDELFHSFGNLITGTHTLSFTVVSGHVTFDYIDVWDGQPTPEATTNIRRAEDSGRLYYSTNIRDRSHPGAIEGDFVGVPIFNFPANLWYNFVGDSFTFYYFSERNGGSVNVYVDGQFVETVSQDYEFSPQPFAVSYDGFGEGPHVVRVESVSAIRADAFRSPADPLPYMPSVEWFDTTPNGGTGAFGTPAGAIMGMAVGDVNEDGATEIVLPSDTSVPDVAEFVNSIFIFRGDGEDTGDGDPIIERIDIEAGGVGREFIGSVAIAELDGQPGAEIVAAGSSNMYAFHNDGSTYWMTDTLPARDIRGTPVIGNLDLDPEPEIVVNLQETLAVFEHDGTIAWTETLPADVGMPLLADMDENGTLDIVAYDVGGTVYLYDYNYGAPTLEWSTTLSSTIDFIFGGPAVADVDGQQPGGDDGPEIAITSNGRHTVLDADGSVVWSTALDPGDGGGVSIADVDGDGEIELVTGTKYDDGTGVGRLYALNADGSILWGVPAYDSTSANSQSVLDLNGDGVYEIAWNGAQYGFTIFNGVDGSILYNDPLIESLTGTEYPIFADVDNDGYAEVAVPYNDGLAVVGMDGVWGESRAVWNQHSYHVTNVNDDLTVPQSEANSWEVHNTFRTQWPDRAALPTHDVTVTHTAAISGVTVLPDTFSSAPSLSADPLYRWDYTQTWEQTAVTRTFASELSDLRPGEARLVSQGTDVQYTVPGGSNSITLPPLYVSAYHIIAVDPLSQTVGIGGTAVYTVTLSNPAATGDTYSLNTTGLPEEWVTLPASVAIAAHDSATVPLTITVPATTEPDALSFVVSAENESGGIDQAGASLATIDALGISISPSEQTAAAGETVTYTLNISNHETVARTYALTASGLASVALPASVTVPANGSQSLTIQVTAGQGGPHPFTVHARSDGAAASVDGLLGAIGSRHVGVALTPEPAIAGPGTPAVLTMTVTNLGDVADSYDLTVDLPAGWSYALDANGANVGSVSLPPHVFNSANLDLAVTPDTGALPGSYTITATARSQTQPATATTVTGTVEVLNRGVQVNVDPASATLHPDDAGVWQVTITNTGSVADSYWLTATGIVGLSGEFSTNPVSLSPGQVATVQLTADDLAFGLSTTTYPFAVAATLQDDGRVRAEKVATVTFEETEAVEVAWKPASQTITDTYSAAFLLVVTNTGNIQTTYHFDLDVASLSGGLPVSELAIPARATVVLPLFVEAGGPGTYAIEGTAVAAGAEGGATATLTIISTNEAPTASAGPDQGVDEGDLVTFSGSGADPEGSSLTIHWDFGDGASATGTLSPSHTYADDGEYVVTLSVTDETGSSASDTLVVSVENVAPVVDAGADQTVDEGVAVQLSGSFTDPGALDTHTIVWAFGDGETASGTLSPAHVYEEAGVYTVTLTVTDDDGGQDSDEVTVTVLAGERQLFLPIISTP